MSKISPLIFIVAQAVSQSTYAACSVDTGFLVAAGETCAGSSLNYAGTGLQQRAISTSGDGSNLTLLDGTTASGLSVWTITVGGTNSVLNTGGLSIVNENVTNDYWTGIDILDGNKVYVNGDLDATRIGNVRITSYAVDLKANSELYVSGNVNFNNVGGGMVFV